MTEQTRQTPADARVSWPQLIAYGAGGIIPIALFNIAGQLMALLGNISLGLSAVWLGAIMMVPRLWDAVSDPVMGHITDNTRTRWGRRRPFLLFGGIAVAITFVAMWWVPRGESVEAWFSSEAAYNWFQLAFILGGMLTFYTACTLFEIPHGALGMEMSTDYHERTRLFSSKSFFGNIFAIGTPGLITLAGWKMFSGPGGDLVDGMRFVSMFVAVLLVPMSFWWFWTLKEPGFEVAKTQQKIPFWRNMRSALSNKTFLTLILIIFTLAMGFNFVGIFSYYIQIFYLYSGDANSAGKLLFWNGAIWAVTGLLAVFPLNMISQQLGKNKTLQLAILLMSAAQLAKIVCYQPALPYLIFIPTMFLSAGMLMFFTLGASMVGDICDEDELRTGTRSEGSYYSVYWWFIKMGTAFASFVTGLLLVYTTFDENQNVSINALRGSIEVISSDAQLWQKQEMPQESLRAANLEEHLVKANTELVQAKQHFSERIEEQIGDPRHMNQLIVGLNSLSQSLEAMKAQQVELLAAPAELERVAEALLQETTLLKQQSPTSLFRLRAVEISLPLILCAVSLWLTLGYPLTEARSYEITAELKKRHVESVA